MVTAASVRTRRTSVVAASAAAPPAAMAGDLRPAAPRLWRLMRLIGCLGVLAVLSTFAVTSAPSPPTVAPDALPEGQGVSRSAAGATAADGGGPDRPLRVYMAPLPREFDMDADEFLYLFGDDLHLPDRTGFGRPMRLSNPHLRRTGQFAAEVLFRNLIENGPLLVDTIEQADIVWVPVGFGNMYMAEKRRGRSLVEAFKRIRSFFDHVMSNGTFLPYLEQLPHVILLGRVARDYDEPFKHPAAHKFLFASIEVPMQWQIKNVIPTMVGIPYPTAVHYSDQWWPEYSKEQADAFVETKFMPVSMTFGPRQWRPIRQRLATECQEFGPEECLLIQIDPSLFDYNITQYEEMQNITQVSWLSVQPMGDTPTRRSMYESMLTGTVPVLFNDTLLYDLAFADVIDYRKLVVMARATTVLERTEEKMEARMGPSKPYPKVGLNFTINDTITSMLRLVRHHRDFLVDKVHELLKVRHLFQYALDPHFELITPARRNLTEPRDDAFTSSMKAIMRKLCDAPHGLPAKLPLMPTSRCSI